MVCGQNADSISQKGQTLTFLCSEWTNHLLLVCDLTQLAQSGYRVGWVPVRGLCHGFDNVGYLAAVVGKLHRECWNMVDLRRVRLRHEIAVQIQNLGGDRLYSLGKVMERSTRKTMKTFVLGSSSRVSQGPVLDTHLTVSSPCAISITFKMTSSNESHAFDT